MTDEQIKQNADAYANNYAVKSLYRPAYDGFVAGAHSRDEEIELLRHTLSQAANMLRNGNDKLLADYMVQKIELDQLRNPWKDVKKELPKEGENVIIRTTYNVYYGGYDANNEHFFTTDPDGECWNIIGALYWMQVPELPKGGEA